MNKRTRHSLSASRALAGSFLALLLLAVSQGLALAAGSLFLALGLPETLGNGVVSALYVLFFLFGAAALCRWFLQVPLAAFRITSFHATSLWLVAAVLMPALVVVQAMLAGGRWVVAAADAHEVALTLSVALCYVGAAVGFVEEAAFRGFVMGCFERAFGRVAAVLLPSLAFGLLHVMGRDLSTRSILQLAVAGTMVGVCFSLVTLVSGSIWPSAVMHAVWNAVMIGGVVSIGSEPTALVNFILDSDAFWQTGGDFGIEASLFAVVSFIVFAALAAWQLRRQTR